MQVDKRTIRTVIKKMDENPHLDAVSGMHDRMPSIMKENDFLFMTRRANDFTEVLARRFKDPSLPTWHYLWNRIYTTGWNVAYSAEAYAMIGGYESNASSGEDVLMGQRISIARGDGELPNLDVIGKTYNKTDSSPRRFIMEAVTGRPSYEDGNFEDESINETIREKKLPELLSMISDVARIDETNQDQFKSWFTNYYSFVQTITPDTLAAQAVYKRMMVFLALR
jgi:hypothetical protein